ncbi:MAG: tRNA (adenosine(37)-N6)-threonylcarbamoyltransferase complex ATPase subunit type 1 TsaE [Lachnospiraceae bacterium]|nr:tRNA (adenosine(37)-N6)-threonylcarbamoyltransferase complex ATPase subunit type 1 TsaE [Lachnospiraceae bacterium]
MIFESNSENDTFEYARRMGENAKPGEIYCLNGDLGTGKTVFSKGFAKGLGIEDHITSPTFTIVQEYEGRLKLYHMDVYRIADSEEMYEIGFDEMVEGDGVCLIEWAQIIDDILPKDRISVTIRKNLDKGLDHREIEIV